MSDNNDSVRPSRYNLRRSVRAVPDILPQAPEPVNTETTLPATPARVLPDGLSGPAPQIIQTKPNIFGLWKEYDYPPSVDPDNSAEVSHYLSAKLQKAKSVSTAFSSSRGVSCKRHELLLQWHTSGSGQKSLNDTSQLVKNVIQHPEFNPDDFKDNAWKKAFAALGESSSEDGDGWFQHDIEIEIPLLRRYWDSDDEDRSSVRHTLKRFRCRRLCALIRFIVQNDPSASNWTFEPYRLFVTQADGHVERILGQVYWSDEMIEEHAVVQRKVIPEDRGGALPRSIIALMFGSDATHLGQFGTDSAWPAYLMFGNKDKYLRARPSAAAVHQLAFFEKASFRFYSRLIC